MWLWWPGKHKARKDKAERLAKVMEGREGRDKFGARSSLKKKKTAGFSEREKQRRKVGRRRAGLEGAARAGLYGVARGALWLVVKLGASRQ